jgi:hypothetical protein
MKVRKRGRELNALARPRLFLIYTPCMTPNYVYRSLVAEAAGEGEAAAHPGVRGVELQLRRRLAGHAVLRLGDAGRAGATFANARQKGGRIIS